MEATDSSLHQDRSELNPLDLTQDDPEWEKGELIDDSSSPEDMDPDAVLEHDTYLDGGPASNTGATSGTVNDFQDEEMDTTAQPSEAESYSG